MNADEKPKARRGFAAIDPKRLREIATQGGKAAHAAGTAHKFTREEAREAGRKGGKAAAANRVHMAEIGRLGGKASARERANRDANPDNGEE